MKQPADERKTDLAPAPVSPPSPAMVQVWDLPMRVFHWGLVAATMGGLATGFLAMPRGLRLHLLAGAALAALLVFRGVWALLGSGSSRVSALLFPPSRILARIRGEDRERYLGHNPLAGLVLASVLAVLVGLVLTGVVVLGGEEQRGPLRAWLSWDTGDAAKAIHSALSWAVVAGIGAHLAGLLHEGRSRREAVARSMITGLRALDPPARRPKPALARPALALAITASLVGAAAAGTLATSQRAPSGWRALDVDPDWPRFEAECGACHTLYHPSLLAADAWREMMSGLGDHFGEDASLSAGAADAITAFLAGNANATWDTEAVNLLRPRPGSPPAPAVTGLPAWKSLHGAAIEPLAPETSPAACERCHPDAVEGVFAGDRIHDPTPEPSP